MNTSFSNRAVKVIASALTAVVLLVGNPLTTKANDGGIRKSSSLTDQQVSVKYQGISDNSIVFKVEFDNPTAEKFWLIIKNDNGDIVYHQQFNDTHFVKNVFFRNTDSEINPTFVIRTSDNTQIVRQFEVNKTLTENTIVTQK